MFAKLNNTKQPHQSIQTWQNLNYQDLEGEVWKELPGYNECYLVSNFGRVKSVDRVIHTKNNKQIFYSGRILKGVLIKYKNTTHNDYIEEIKVGINYCGKHSNIRVARAVYNLFVQQLNFSKDGLMVIHIDGNRHNNHYLNLTIQTNAQKQSKLINTERRIKIHKYHTNETRLKAAVARYKPITQFSLQGIPIKSYSSIKEAALQTGIDNSGIVAAIKQIKMVSAGGFLWQYGIITHKIDTSFYTDFIKKSKQKKAIPIAQFSHDYQVINKLKNILVC